MPHTRDELEAFLALFIIVISFLFYVLDWPVNLVCDSNIALRVASLKMNHEEFC